jgi:hypothetical protein
VSDTRRVRASPVPNPTPVLTPPPNSTSTANPNTQQGFWNHAPASMGGGQYRILNNTAGCIGPWLALFREQPPHLHWRATSTSNPAPTPPAPRHDTAGCTALGISPCAEPSTRRALCKGVVRSPLSLTPPPILRQADRARQLVD